jgi:hypothetical protein
MWFRPSAYELLLMRSNLLRYCSELVAVGSKLGSSNRYDDAGAEFREGLPFFSAEPRAYNSLNSEW